MKFLIAGFGSIGRRHFRNLLALGERDILLYRSHYSTLPDDEIADFPVEIRLEDALAHQPDAVIISNPTALHLEVAIPAAQAGCHLFLEKPVSHSLEDIEALQSAVAQGGGQVFTAFQFRFHPGLQEVKRLLSEGVIGRALSARADWGEYLPDWHPWEDYRQGYSARADLGGGVILTLCHPLDYLRWLLGDVRSLWAFTGRLGDLDLDVEDTAEIGLQFHSGVIASLHLDYNQRPPAHHLEIVGTQGTLRWDNQDGAVRFYRAENEKAPLEAPHWEIIPAPPDFERNQLFLDEMRHFLRVVRGDIRPSCTLEDGIRALELALSAHQSAVQKRQIEFL